MKKLIPFIFVFLFLSCSKKEQILVKKSSSQTGENESVYVCSSVKTIGDEYVPLLNTNVFIKTDDKDLAFKIENRLIYYHKLFDQYHYYYDDETTSTMKNLALLNDYILKGENFYCDFALSMLLESSFLLMKLSDNYFNPFINPVFKLYDGFFSAFPIKRTDPDRNMINNALTKVLTYQQLENELSVKDGAVEFDTNSYKDYSLNMGAIAKGFVAQMLLNEFSNDRFLLSLGSSTIVANKRNAKVGIASPYYRTLPLFQINLDEKIFLSTSSTTNNYYLLEEDERIVRSHIINPKTGYSNNDYWAVVVLSSNGEVSDSLSTALFNVSDIDTVRKIIENVKKEFNCFLEVCFVKDCNREQKTLTLLMTKGFKAFINTDFSGAGLEGSEIF